MNDELQERALEIVMRHPEAQTGELEACWDDVWLWLYEGMDWAAAAEIDFDDLASRVRKAVELKGLRAAGWSETEINAWEKVVDMRNLVATSRPAPGEVLDRRHWVGALAEAIALHLNDLAPHPFLRPVESRIATPGRIAAMLEKLGAPDTCVVGQLETPALRLNLYRRDRPPGYPEEFAEGSRLPLGTALEIAEDSGWEAELYCVPGRLAYVQHHEIDTAGSRRDVALRAIVYRPRESF